ncbi:MAG: hypothetical protein HKO56_08635 [Bacteroidia bacterium]|nr:hypothetical protein [Bacteroidia bacterium]NNC85667.1 hypothetical protein [Bacteroidia bacterium]NNM16711.1 hypothetical protein [Bacteroidia bacterium]
MVKYSTKTLTLLEDTIKENEFVLRYEKGQFNSGYCIIDNRKVIIVNKFFQTESRINTLLEIINKLKTAGNFHISEEVENMFSSLKSE